MRIPIIQGNSIEEGIEIRTVYPQNLVPVFESTGFGDGYLRPTEGVQQVNFTTRIGQPIYEAMLDLGNNELGCIERASNSYILDINTFNATGDSVTATHSTILDPKPSEHAYVATVPDQNVRIDHSFDRTSISLKGRLYYYTNTNGRREVHQVVDPDLGVVLDHLWIDGYFMTTDGESLVVTNLNDPTSVNPFKYGSSEIDPDPIVALQKLRNEVYVLNRNTIEVFGNIGGTGFPFQRITGAQITKGCVGTQACCVFEDSIAFVGGAYNEAPAVWVARQGSVAKISTRSIDVGFSKMSELQLSQVKLEAVVDKDHSFLVLHMNPGGGKYDVLGRKLPPAVDEGNHSPQTAVFDAIISRATGSQVWHTLTTNAHNYTRFRNRWYVNNRNDGSIAPELGHGLGFLNPDIATAWGRNINWEFTIPIIYLEGYNGLIHELELVKIRQDSYAPGTHGTVTTQHSVDGDVWTLPKSAKVTTPRKRLVWLNEGPITNARFQRFRGSGVRLSVAALLARIEALNNTNKI